MQGQTFTIGKIHYINGLVYVIARQDKIDVATLKNNSAEIIKSGRAQHPMDRIRMLARLAEGIGLISKLDNKQYAITDLGKRYYEARDSNPWCLSSTQKTLLRNHILSHPSDTRALFAISTLLRLVNAGQTGTNLAHTFAGEIGKEGVWNSDVTYQGFTKYGLDYLKELGFLQKNVELSKVIPDHKKRANRNPKWSRDELILALELYMRVNPLHTSDNNPDIIALSETLNSLPIHPQAEHGEKFRNANGVYMKLCNFLRFDPNYRGSGLQRGGKLEKAVWDEFSLDVSRLKATATAILLGAPFVSAHDFDKELNIDEGEEFPEGRILTQLHKRRERNKLATKKKKYHISKTKGNLACEVCNFDFQQVYGALGFGFAECHHRKPLAELNELKNTKLEDLAIVCANCHRMLHRARPWITVEELRQAIHR